MKIGFCAGLDLAPAVKALGYDYIELPLAPLASLPEADFAAASQTFRQTGLPCLVCNVFLPGSVKVTGPDADLAIAQAYVRTALSRAADLGAAIVVFGSGGSRNLPAGWPMRTGLAQMAAFGRMAATIASDYGITLALEPLNVMESNIINRVSEALIMVQAIDHPNFRLLGDTYHMRISQEDLSVLSQAGPDLCHVHVSNLLGRKIPLAADRAEHSHLIAVLQALGYPGCISIEAAFRHDQAAEAAEALQVFRDLTIHA